MRLAMIALLLLALSGCAGLKQSASVTVTESPPYHGPTYKVEFSMSR